MFIPHSWRTSNGQEVDFILYGDKGFFAVEVKRKSRLQSKDFNGLKAFLTDYPEAKGLLLYIGDLTEYHDNITVLPFNKTMLDLSKIIG